MAVFKDGSLVKGSRRRPLTAETGVRFPHELLKLRQMPELFVLHFKERQDYMAATDFSQNTGLSRRYDSVLFDLDGTLTDSGPGITKAASYALEKLGMGTHAPSTLDYFVGPPLSWSFAKAGVSEDLIEEAIRLYRVYDLDKGKWENSPYDGIAALLTRLQEEGFRLFVATSKPEALSMEILRRFDLDRYFEIIAGATNDHTRENKNDVIRYLLEKTGDTGKTIMVGDTEFDVKGAADLKIGCIGVSWGYGSIENMKKAGAVGIAATPEKLYDLLHS